MRQREYLAVVRSGGEHLTLSTLVFPDEVIDPAAVEGLEEIGSMDLSDRERSMAASLVMIRSSPTTSVTNTAASVMELIEAKAAVRTLSVDAIPDRAEVVDLAAALEASVEAARASRDRHPTARKASVAKPLAVKKSA